MDDLISRQAAIDICRAPHMRNADCSDFEMAIMMLPSAKPDVPDTNVGNKLATPYCPWCGSKMQNNDYGYYAAQTEQQWIPCKDRLPEEGVDVLISYRYKEGEGDTSHMYIDIASYGTVSFGGHKLEGIKEWGQPFAYFTSNYEVVAWMPLPEPYKEEGEEK